MRLTIFLIAITAFICQCVGCSKPKTQSPEEVVSAFLEAASYADINTMRRLTAANMLASVERDALALQKLVFFEREGLSALLKREAEENYQNKEEIKKLAKLNKPDGNFDFSFKIKTEATMINRGESAKVFAILKRKNNETEAVYELKWTGERWLIVRWQPTNRRG